MNCFIILLLLCCCGHSNGVCSEHEHDHNHDHNHNHDHSCGCGENSKDDSCNRDDRCENDHDSVNCDRCNDDRKDDRWDDRRDDRRDGRRFEERRDWDSDDYDKRGMRTMPWQDSQGYNRNNESSYGRNETCGCEEK